MGKLLNTLKGVFVVIDYFIYFMCFGSMMPFTYNVIPILFLFIGSIFCVLIPCMVYSTTESEGAEALFSINIGIRFTFTIIFLAQALTKWNEYFAYLILQLITFIPSAIIRIVEIMQKKEDIKETDNDKTDAEKGTKLVEIKE